MLEKVKSRLHVRGECCASVFLRRRYTRYAGIESRLPHFNFLEICRSSNKLPSSPSFLLSSSFLFNFNLESGLHVAIIFNTTEYLVRNCFFQRVSFFLFLFSTKERRG